MSSALSDLVLDLIAAMSGGALISLALPVSWWRCALAAIGIYLIRFAMWRPERK